ncbi:hypothetical protein [Synechococcus phage BUCT-ZZ01]|nr:hypothetical protein [Synechococcus phage BUCT-ZZ01]
MERQVLCLRYNNQLIWITILKTVDLETVHVQPKNGKFHQIPSIVSKKDIVAVSNEVGSPFDRGCADAYYGSRRAEPHKFDTNMKTITELTEEETLQYLAGFYGETDRKNYD